MLQSSNIKFEISDRIAAIGNGGIGMVHKFAVKSGLQSMIDDKLKIFKIHKPYFESDHVLNLMYNVVSGGECLDDLESLRNNPAFLDALGATRIPDPTTAGDFLRRFDEGKIAALTDIMNEMNQRMWRIGLSKTERESCIIDVDGKLQFTYGECKENMDITYKSGWGFSTLLITEARTGLHLQVVNRPGCAVSHEDAAIHIRNAVTEARKTFKRIYLRGDTDFSLTKDFDKWHEDKISFVTGYDAKPNLKKIAENIARKSWKLLLRETLPEQRAHKTNVKKIRVEERGFTNIVLEKEFYTEMNYQPIACDNKYRLIIVRKHLKVLKGQQLLGRRVRYFFYISNIEDQKATELLDFVMQRCNHENRIEQMANGVHALKMPVAEFNANWAYMLICAMAWNLKGWLALLGHRHYLFSHLMAAEFKKFLNDFIRIPCQIVKTGRSTIYRFLGYHRSLEDFFKLDKILDSQAFSSA